MNFNKMALEYVFNSCMVAWYCDKARFLEITRFALENWSVFRFKKLMQRLKREGIIL